MAIMMTLQLALLLAITAVSSAHFELWQNMFRRNLNWRGHYGWYGVNHTCSLHVNSVQSGIYGVVYVTFEDGEAVIDLTVSSSNETMVFKLETIHIHSSKFPNLVDIVVNTKAKFTDGHWLIMGNFVEPKQRGFSDFYLVNKAQSTTPKQKPSAMSLGLAIGIPMSLFVIITVTAILLLVWAVRKGYLRHVPSSFQRFRNPPDRRESEYNVSDAVNISLENQTAATVHM